MSSFLHKKILYIYWIVVLLSGASLYFDLGYSAITEPLLAPILLLYMFFRDSNIVKPYGKLFFFMGLFLAFLGDVLQIAINNEIFFMSSLVAFMLMNICYSIAFINMDKHIYRRPWFFIASCVVLVFMAIYFINFLGEEALGDYQLPLILYIATLCIMISAVANLTDSNRYKKIAFNWLLPGALIFMIQNMFLAINLFHLGSESKLYTFSIVPYGIAQFMMVRGMYGVYNERGTNEQKNKEQGTGKE